MKKILDKRPWGKFEQFTHNEKTTVKILYVLPKRKLSLQYHNHRSEFWKILLGNPLIIIGDKEFKAKPGDEFMIPKRTNHRIVGGISKSEVLEISFGDFDENDIVRLEDKYNRL